METAGLNLSRYQKSTDLSDVGHDVGTMDFSWKIHYWFFFSAARSETGSVIQRPNFKGKHCLPVQIRTLRSQIRSQNEPQKKNQKWIFHEKPIVPTSCPTSEMSVLFFCWYLLKLRPAVFIKFKKIIPSFTRKFNPKN